MEEYKLSISNLICDTVINSFQNQNVNNDVIFQSIRSILNDLHLEFDDWVEPISKALQGNRSSMPIHFVLSRYGYDKLLKNNSNPTFEQVWVEINDIIMYFNLFIPDEVYYKLESLVEDLTKEAVKKNYSWDKRVVARFIVKKGYENALKESNMPDEELIKESTFKILGTMYGFGNPGLLFAVRDLLDDKFYNEDKFGEALSKVAFEDIIRMGNPNENIDFEMWIGRKVKLMQDMDYIGDEELKNNLVKSNYKELFLEYLLSAYNIEDAVHNEFIVDVGNRSYGTMVDQEFLLRIICTTANFETIDELRGDIDYIKHERLENAKINQMLEYFGWQDDPNVKSIIDEIKQERRRKALQELMKDSPFDNSSLF